LKEIRNNSSGPPKSLNDYAQSDKFMTEFAYYDPNDPSTVYVSQPPISNYDPSSQAAPPPPVPAPTPAYSSQPGYNTQPGYSPQPGYNTQPGYNAQPGYGMPPAPTPAAPSSYGHQGDYSVQNQYPSPMAPPTNYSAMDDQPGYAPVPNYKNNNGGYQ
jgi:hypothetical protein